jgi:hypothetical protein
LYIISLLFLIRSISLNQNILSADPYRSYCCFTTTKIDALLLKYFTFKI